MNTHHRRSNRLSFTRKSSLSDRGGIIVVLTAVLMVVMLGMVAFAIDVGCMLLGRTEIQRAVDAGALAGAGTLSQGVMEAQLAAFQFTQRNDVLNKQLVNSEIDIELGNWDVVNNSFQPNLEPITAIRVAAQAENRPLFFGRVFGWDEFNTRAEAIARFQPRDIVLVLDYSASMNDDSELKQIRQLGRSTIETNLRDIYNELGAPVFGSMQWNPVYIASDNTNVVMNSLGLSSVPYPYPSGSWADYVNYVRTSASVNSAGYRKRYGYLTLVNYFLERQPRNDQTPDLWMTSEQPVTAVKDAVALFLAFVQEVDTDDQVGLVIYTAANGGATLESGLTGDMQLVEDISRRRQAGHYDHYTNIAAGLREARLELVNNGRPASHKLVVLMTDGIANRPSNSTVARNAVNNEAQLTAGAGLPVVTISLGAGADQNLMQQVADTTAGVHFNVPGDGSVSQYEEDLKDVFRQIAEDRHLTLVK